MDTEMQNGQPPIPYTDRQASQIAACADMLNLLSRLISYPTADVAEGLSCASIASDARQIALELRIDPDRLSLSSLDAYAGSNPDEVFDDIRKSYTAMFTHPLEPLLAITEMRFCDIENKAETPSTAFLNLAALHAEQCYRHAGFALSNAQSREPGDHMAAELEYTSKLYTRLYAAIVQGDAEAVREQQDLILEFRPHLDAWAASFFDSCAHHEEHPLYAWTGIVGRAYFEAYADFPECPPPAAQDPKAS